jgi:hypothetical protein
MKVYATRSMETEYGWMPVIGWHRNQDLAKKHAKRVFDRTAEWDVAQYEAPTNTSLEMWIDLLNADTILAEEKGKTPREHLKFVKIVFQSAALKQRYRKERHNDAQ